MGLEHVEDFQCPYCGENNGILIDYSGGQHQEFVVDCEVCCAPITIRLRLQGQEIISLDIQRENE